MAAGLCALAVKVAARGMLPGGRGIPAIAVGAGATQQAADGSDGVGGPSGVSVLAVRPAGLSSHGQRQW